MNTFKVDGITSALVTVAIVIGAFSIVFCNMVPILSIVILIGAIIRFFVFDEASRNRQTYFVKLGTSGVVRKVKNLISNFNLGDIQKRLTHDVVGCPNCKQKLRVPKKKGNITVICPKCKYTFKTRT